MNDLEFCKACLNKVSRTFAINIHVLRGDVYKGMLLAYLFCRIADTIEDDPFFTGDYKIQKLHEYSELFPPASGYENRIKSFLKDIHFDQKDDSTDLVENSVRVFNEFVELPDNIISDISALVKEMAIGMAKFQEKDTDKKITFLKDQNELERYCYFVAGTVGLMVTSLFSEGSKKITPEIRDKLLKRSVAFGLGLQMTNIAKDFFGDRERGWCYVPHSFFSAEGIDPLHYSFDERSEAFLSVHKRLINLALDYLDEALKYTLDIPRSLLRYRLFCLWPLFMAVETLAKLYGEQTLLTGKAVKISRSDVKRIVRNTSLAVMSNSTLKKMYYNTRHKIG